MGMWITCVHITLAMVRCPKKEGNLEREYIIELGLCIKAGREERTFVLIL